MHEQVINRLQQAITDHVFPGCIVGIVYKNGEKAVIPAGQYTYEEGSPKITENSVFDVASITKSIPSASLALQLLDEGKINLDDQLITYLPEFNNTDREQVQIRHLLTHTLDYNFRLSSYKDNSPDEILHVLFTTNFKTKPGTTFFYTNATSILLGMVVEKVFGAKLDELGEKRFFAPLGMGDTTFHPEKFGKTRVVPTEYDDWRGRLIQGEVHDESAYTLSSKMLVGSAGLFSTAPDLLTFLEMLLNNGRLHGRKYFSPEILKQIQTNQLASIHESAGLGWELNQPRYMGKYCTEHTFGKTGFTGCVIMCDIEKGIGIVILSNYTFPQRKSDASLINTLRRDIADIVFES